MLCKKSILNVHDFKQHKNSSTGTTKQIGHLLPSKQFLSSRCSWPLKSINEKNNYCQIKRVTFPFL